MGVFFGVVLVFWMCLFVLAERVGVCMSVIFAFTLVSVARTTCTVIYGGFLEIWGFSGFSEFSEFSGFLECSTNACLSSCRMCSCVRKARIYFPTVFDILNFVLCVVLPITIILLSILC